MRIELKYLKAHKDFLYIFITKEGIALLGRRYLNLIILFIIMSITIIAIGFANGSLKYLEHKMDNIFIKWISIEVPANKESTISQVKNVLDTTKRLKEQYFYNQVSGHFKYSVIFWDKNKQSYDDCLGRTIQVTSQLLDEILGKKNFIKGNKYANAEEIGLIVTEEFLHKYNYDRNDLFVDMYFADIENNEYRIPLPIRAIVKELPGKNLFATTPNMFLQLTSSSHTNPFNPNDTKRLLLYIPGDSSNAINVYNRSSEFFETNNEYNAFIAPPKKSELTYKKGSIISIKIKPEVKSVNELNEICESLEKSLHDQGINTTNIYNYERKLHKFNSWDYEKFNYINIHFDELENIRLFQRYLSKEYDLNIDMAQIEASENYDFVTKLTRIISIILIGFSILSICMFVSQLLKKHLDKIKMNIGTFKAFGLDDGILLKIYLIIINAFIIISLLGAFLLALIFGEIGGVRALLSIFPNKLEQGQKYFDLFNIWTLSSVILVILISYIVVRYTAKKILSKTPGDLIYTR